MLDWNASLPECEEKLVLRSFYDLRNQVVYQALIDCKSGDLLILQNHLRDIHQLEAVGGLTYLAGLTEKVPSAANLPNYIGVLLEKQRLRDLISACTEIVGKAYEHEGSVDTILAESERAFSQAVTVSNSSLKPIRELTHTALNQIEAMHARQGKIDGISTGFADLDKLTCGMHGGEMIVIGARPSQGKTSLAMNIAETVAIEQALPVGVFSLEMSAESLVLRMLCSGARVNAKSIQEGYLAERDVPKLTVAASKLVKAPIYIDDAGGITVNVLRGKARRMWQQYGIRLFVIDYLQLLHGGTKFEKRSEEMTCVSGAIKALAKELNVPVIVLAQLSRATAKEKRKPRVDDLRESGAIEQDADVIGLLYKPKDEDEDEDGPIDESGTVTVNLDIAKQRSGRVGTLQLTFLKCFTRFENAAKIAKEDVQQ